MAVDIRASITAWAESQEGKPYQWGGIGPNGYDCSGLVYEAYLHGGNVHIPRVAAAQQAAGHGIDASQLQPSDLCFEGHPAYHVVMYAGSGQVVAADHSGTNVRMRPFDAAEFTGGFRTFNLPADTSGVPIDTTLTGIHIPNPLAPLEGVYHVIEGIDSVFKRLASVTWWERIGKGALGLFIIIATFVIINRKRIGEAAITTAKAIK